MADVTGEFELREHTADVAIEATGETLGGAFAAVANGLAAAQCDDLPATGGERFQFEETATNREALLFDYLDRCIYERDVRSVLPVAHDATVQPTNGTWTVRASARGVPLEEIAAREVKAVTYSEMEIRETDTGWYAYVVLDV